jgi:predicted PurR-regulated permease PerM
MSEPDPASEDATAAVADERPADAAAAPTQSAAPPATMPATTPDPETPPVMVALDSRFLRRALIMVVLAVIGLQIINYAWGLLGGFLFNLLLAWLIAISFDPIVSYLAHRGMRRGLATAIVAFTTLGLLGLFITLFGGVLAAQTVELVQALPALVLDIVDWVNRTFNAEIDPERLLDNLNLTAEQATDIAGSLAGGILAIFVGIVGAVFDFVTILVFSFYFSADSPRIKRWIASWLKPARQVVFIQVWDISVQKAGGFVISKLALATLSAAFHSFFFYLIDIPFWLPMGIFAGVVSQFIPTIGTYIGVALPALFAVFDDPIDVLWIVIFATVYQQIENYVFTPRISTKTMDINSGVALASVFVGAALFGPIGAIIGIPLAAIVIAVFEAYGQRYEVHPYVERNAD